MTYTCQATVDGLIVPAERDACGEIGPSPADTSPCTMRDHIKRLATRLFTLRGYRGVSFGDLTEELGTTRANIHYHFGSKTGLAEEVLADAAEAVLLRYRSIWIDPGTTLKTKLEQSFDFNQETYRQYNTANEGRIWSLITRFRLDMDVITPKMVAELNEVTRVNEESIEQGVRLAMQNGELIPDAPIAAIESLISGVVHFASLISQAPHDIGRLEQTYEALSILIHRAYARASKEPVDYPQ